MKDILLRHRYTVWVGVVLLVYLLASTSHISKPGLYYDECLFINAALGGINGDSLYAQAAGIPLMVMPYIGALKSWIYFPVFYTFGVSALTIRLPALLISTLSLFLLYRFTLNFFRSQALAILTLLLAATDPAYLFTSRLDWGPTVLANLFCILSLYSFDRLMVTSHPKWAWALGAALCLGLFNKLNFLWLILSLGLAVVLFYGWEVWRLVRTKTWRILLPLGVTAAVLVFLGIELIAPVILSGSHSQFTFSNFSSHALYTWNLSWGTLEGRSVYGMVFRHDPAGYNAFPILFSTCLACCFISIFRGDKFLFRAGFFVIVCFGGIYAQILLTHDATGPHHMMALWPFYELIICAGLANILGVFKEMFHPPIGIGVVSIAVFIQVLLQINLYAEYETGFVLDRKIDKSWSTSIYELSDYLNSEENSHLPVVMADWGIENQVFGLSKPGGRTRFHDNWPSFTKAGTQADRNYLFKLLTDHHAGLLIAHGETTSVFPETRLGLKAMLAEHPNITLDKVISRDGSPLFEIYRCPAQ